MTIQTYSSYFPQFVVSLLDVTQIEKDGVKLMDQAEMWACHTYHFVCSQAAGSAAWHYSNVEVFVSCEHYPEIKKFHLHCRDLRTC